MHFTTPEMMGALPNPSNKADLARRSRLRYMSARYSPIHLPSVARPKVIAIFILLPLISV